MYTVNICTVPNMYGYFYSTVFNMLSVLYPVLNRADYTWVVPKTSGVLEIFGFGVNILYILNISIRYNVLCTANIWIRYNVLCTTVHIYIYIVETPQDGVGTPPGATKIVETFFLIIFFLKIILCKQICF